MVLAVWQKGMGMCMVYSCVRGWNKVIDTLLERFNMAQGGLLGKYLLQLGATHSHFPDPIPHLSSILLPKPGNKVWIWTHSYPCLIPTTFLVKCQVFLHGVHISASLCMPSLTAPLLCCGSEEHSSAYSHTSLTSHLLSAGLPGIGLIPLHSPISYCLCYMARR